MRASAPDYWRWFAERFWEKAATAVESGEPGPLGPRELFAALARACIVPTKVDLAIDNVFVTQLARKTELLPRAEDGDLAGYEERMRATCGPEADYMLRVGNLQLYDEQLWRWACRFLRPLYDVVGIPNRNVAMGVFLGRYKRTAFGVHVDGQSAITFPIIGRKRVRIWSDEFARRHPQLDRSHDYQAFVPQSTLLEAEPGGFLYWPSTAWHVGEGEDGLVATWNISFWYGSPSDIAASITGRLIDAMQTAGFRPPREFSFPTDRLQEVASALPPALVEVGAAIKRAFAPEAVDDDIARSWLKKVSGLGFQRVPAPAAVARLRPEDLVQGDADFPIIWIRSSRGEYALSARGQLVVVAGRTGIVELVARLNTGQRLKVERLMVESARGKEGETPPLTPSFVLSLLNQLRSIGALLLVAGPQEVSAD